MVVPYPAEKDIVHHTRRSGITHRVVGLDRLFQLLREIVVKAVSGGNNPLHQFIAEKAEAVPRLDIGEAQRNDRRPVLFGHGLVAAGPSVFAAAIDRSVFPRPS